MYYKEWRVYQQGIGIGWGINIRKSVYKGAGYSMDK